jgi:hypothetical protein
MSASSLRPAGCRSLAFGLTTLILLIAAVGCSKGDDRPTPPPGPEPVRSNPTRPRTGPGLPPAPPNPDAPRPRVLSISPRSGRPGTEVTLTGEHFRGSTQVKLVQIETDTVLPIPSIQGSETSLTVTIPELAAGPVVFMVEADGGLSPRSADSFQVEALVAPAPGPSGAEGARTGHRAALALLDQNLAAGHSFRSVLSPRTFDLTEEYLAGRAVIDEFKTRRQPAGQPKINYDYVYADPYLASHNVDINQEVPEEVTDAEWESIQNALGTSLLVLNPDEFDWPFGTFGTAPEGTREVIRKRIKRLFLNASERTRRGEAPIQASLQGGTATPLDELALDMCQQHGRCIDGCLNGLGDIEAKVFGRGTGIADLGEFISNVLTDYKMEFISRHGQLQPTNPEFRTELNQLLKQKMLYSMGLRGHFEPMRYAGYGPTDGPLFSSERVMRRFLGGEANLCLETGYGPRISFEAYTVDKLVALLQAAHERSYLDPSGTRLQNPGQLGLKLSPTLLRAEFLDSRGEPRDPVVGAAWQDFEIVNAMATGNDYFQPAAAGQWAGNFRLTRAFWIHMLTTYGYILP